MILFNLMIHNHSGKTCWSLSTKIEQENQSEECEPLEDDQVINFFRFIHDKLPETIKQQKETSRNETLKSEEENSQKKSYKIKERKTKKKTIEAFFLFIYLFKLRLKKTKLN